MKDSLLKAVVDIGNSKVKVVLGELSDNGQKIRVVSSAETTSQGMRKSLVEDTEKLSRSVGRALEIVENDSGLKIERVSIGVAGKHIKSTTKNMKFNFSKADTVIEDKDIEILYDMAQKEMVTSNEKIIKKEIYNIRVDNSGILKHPIGMTGSFIEGDVHLITSEIAHIDSLVEVVNKAGREVENITLNAYASAESILSPEDKKMGVALIDIGEGSTDIIIFKNDKLIYTKSIPLGGMHYTNDIAYIFNVDRIEAEKLRNLCQNKKLDESIKIDINGEERQFSVSSVRDVIDARSEDIVRYVVAAIEESGFKGYLGNGVILTGGAVMVEGVVEKLSKDLNYKVKIGMPMMIKGITEVHPSMSTSIGILLETLENEHNNVKNDTIIEEQEVRVDSSDEQKDESSVKKEVKPKKDKKMFSLKEWLSNFI